VLAGFCNDGRSECYIGFFADYNNSSPNIRDQTDKQESGNQAHDERTPISRMTTIGINDELVPS
jgi:hypothetical protein